MTERTFTAEDYNKRALALTDAATEIEYADPRRRDSLRRDAAMLRQAATAHERETALREENGRLTVRITELESDTDSYQRQSLIDYDNREAAVRRAEAAEAALAEAQRRWDALKAEVEPFATQRETNPHRAACASMARVFQATMAHLEGEREP